MTIDVCFHAKNTKVRSINICASNFHEKVMKKVPKELINLYEWDKDEEITNESLIEHILYGFYNNNYIETEQEYIDLLVWVTKITIHI